jgi:ABC-2 type transport system permease protein
MFQVREEPSPERVRAAVVDKQVSAGLVFPPDFDPIAGRPGELVIDLAGSPQSLGPLEGALTGLVGRSLMPVAPPTVLVPTSPPGLRKPLDDASSFQLFVPGSAVFFGFFLALTVGISFVQERRSGTFRRLLAAPIRRPTVLVAKLVPYYVVGLIQMAFLFGFGVLIFHMKVAGSWVGLALLTGIVVFDSVSLGLVVASFSGTERQVGAIGSVCLLVMGLLGGGMVPRAVMPATMRSIGSFTPHAWALDGYYDLLIRSGTGVGDIARELGVLAAFGVGFLVLGAARFRFER